MKKMSLIRLTSLLGLFALTISCTQRWEITEDENGILLAEDGRKVFFYQKAPKSYQGKSERCNYIHPLYGVNEQILTQDFPLDTHTDHLHQRGVYWAWHQIYIGTNRIGDAWINADFEWDITWTNVQKHRDSCVIAATVLWKSPLWLDKKGVKKASWESLGEQAIITSLAVSKTSVFVADAGNKIVWKFDKSGTRLQRIGEKNEAKDIPGFIIPSPYFDIGIDPDGFLWAANTGRHSLENYTLEGDFRSFWGKSSMQIDGFSGCCNPTHFVILDDGWFVTSEKGIPRIKVYDRLGRLASVVAGPDRFIEGTTGLDLAAVSSQEIFVLDPKKKEIRIFEKNR